MQGREAEEEVKNWQELDDHGGRSMARTQRREHIDGRLREKVSMWTVLETFSFVFWLNLFNIYDWPHKDSLGSNSPAIPIVLLKVAEVGPHASSSRPRPSLWPPALMFFPSTSADRVSFMPGINAFTWFFYFLFLFFKYPENKTGRLLIVSEVTEESYQDAGSECIRFLPNLHCSP